MTDLEVKDDSEFARLFLDAHNKLRKMHGSKPLSLSDELCSQAQDWANRITKKRHMSYCELPGIGENITYFPIGASAKEIVDYWYSENNKYEYEAPAGTNYFTQIIWRSTREVGVGRARVLTDNHHRSPAKSLNKKVESNPNTSMAQGEEQVVVAFYRPSGNNNSQMFRADQFAINVCKPIKTSEK